jgi:hypothetical protein
LVICPSTIPSQPVKRAGNAFSAGMCGDLRSFT